MRNTPLITATLLVTLSPAIAAAGLPDSGQYLCEDGSASHLMVTCSNANTGDAIPLPRQDGRFGHDPAAIAAAATKTGAGAAGFDYTKVSNTGNDLDASAALGGNADDWGCTRDNITGLLWEVKTTDGGLRDTGWSYTWYSDATRGDGTSNELNAGDAGVENGGTCFNQYDITTNDTGNYCDTAGFVAAVNASGLCGFTDWRLPTRRELETLIHFGAQNPAIDTNYFPNTAALFGDYYWISATWPSSPNLAWYTPFNYGYTGLYGKLNPFHVRLVHGAIY